MTIKILIRADASRSIGFGHVMRCLTLAEELRAQGAMVAFACMDHPGHLMDYIHRKGFTAYNLSIGMDTSVALHGCTVHGRAYDWEADARATCGCMERYGAVDWLIVDHYLLAAPWEFYLRRISGRIMVIDDLADRFHDCDLLLDQNFYLQEDRYLGLLPGHCKMLLGPEYAILRKEFREVRQKMGERSGEIHRILVSFGGADSSNGTGKVLRALQEMDRPEIAIDVVMGSAFSHQESVLRQIDMMPNADCHIQVDYMAQLMAQADLAIGAGGTTIWERCCLGVPSLVMIIAENQRQTTNDLAQAGYLLCLGDIEDVGTDNIKDYLERLMENSMWTGSLSKRSAGLVNGQGIKEVTTNILKSI